jgi:hypothetical protein
MIQPHNRAPVASSVNILPDHIEKLKELKQTKDSFEKWRKYLDSNPDLNLEQSLQSMKDFDIRIPRMVRPYLDIPLTLYRTRVISENSGEDITNKRTFSYPPRTSNFQRASVPGHPVFYGALDQKTAMEELRINGQPVKKGDVVFLSEWKVSEQIRYSLANFTLPEITGEHQLSSDLNKQMDSEIQRIFQHEDEYFKKAQVYLFWESCKLFLKGSYHQSGTIAHDALFKTEAVGDICIAGILYPSCSNNYRSINVAFRPDFVDKHMELVSVKKLIFKEFTNEGAFLTESYFTKISGDAIQWHSYQTKILHQDFRIQLDTEYEWKGEMIDNSSFYIHEHLTDLHTYCREKVDAINLSNYKIPEEQKQLYLNESQMLFVNEFRFSEGVAYLKNGEKINKLKTLRIYIPAEFSTPAIDPTKVLANKSVPPR